MNPWSDFPDAEYIFGCDMQDYADGSAYYADPIPETSRQTTKPAPTQTVQSLTLITTTFLGFTDHGDGSTNHNLSVILGTVIPTVAIGVSLAIGRGCDWLDNNRPGEYEKLKKWLRWAGWAFRVLAKCINYCKNIADETRNDPEAVPMVPNRGQVNEVYTIAYKDE